MNAVDASGMMSMSLSLIAFHPRMLDPSNPNPSSNDDLLQLVDRDREVLPLSREIHELEVDHLDPLVLDES